jgi:sulfide:quinone oxidoreductase
LIEVKPDTKEAVFQLLDSPSNETVTFKYEMLHVCPPQASPEALKKSKLADPANGFLNVDKHSLQHVVYKNVFGIGDCTNVPTAKTAAAVASQSGLLRKNLTKAMKGDENLLKTYDGYTSCPLVIGYNKCILAEFDFYGNPLETFPVDQGIPRTSMYMLKAHMMPSIYWEGLVKGYWEGPSFFRNTMTALGLKSNPVTRTG